MTTKRQKRHRIFRVRVSDAEMAALQNAAGEGREIATWAREKLLGAEHDATATSARFSRDDALAIIRALTPIGSNLRDILKEMTNGATAANTEVAIAHSGIVALIQKIARDID
jgi:hypothetical protein